LVSIAKFQENAQPVWQTVEGASAGYVAGDGERGTGLFPELEFDSEGRAHIVYADHASEHFPGYGSKSFSGQLRYARQKKDKSGWDFFVYEKIDGKSPVSHMIIHPAMAVRADGSAAIAANVWESPDSGETWQSRLALHFIDSKETGNYVPVSATPLIANYLPSSPAQVVDAGSGPAKFTKNGRKSKSGMGKKSGDSKKKSAVGKPGSKKKKSGGRKK